MNTHTKLKLSRLATAVTLTSSLLVASFSANAEERLIDAFTEGEFGASLRWRFEHVNDDAFVNKATAIPLLLRVEYGTADWHGFSLFAEYNYIEDFGVDTYNEGAGNTPDRVDYPVIADPAGGDLNQAYLQWKSGSGDVFRAGREKIVYDNSRFIGDVIWRQNVQTYDALSYDRKGANGFDLRAAYINQVNRIFGDDVPAGQQDMDTYLVNAAYNLPGAGRVVGYYYDINNEDAPAVSNRSLGARVIGDPIGTDFIFSYTLEYAWQSDSGDNPVPFDAQYYRVDLSLQVGNPTAYVGYEVLGGDANQPGQAFRTPLATLHAFNGWADVFLTTPDAGLVDAFVGVKGKLGQWNWNLLYHDFSADSGSEDFGSEWDGYISRKFSERFDLLFKAANFTSDSPSYSDTFKLWVQVSSSF